MTTPGFRIRLHNALVTPIMLMGVPRRLAIINGTLCAAIVLGLHAIYIIFLFIAIHLAAMVLAKKDPHFFEVMLRHTRQKRFYDV